MTVAGPRPEYAAQVVSAPSAAVLPKPRLRGVSHQVAFFASIALGALLIVTASGSRAVVAAAIYAIGLSGVFGISALYHRRAWPTARARTCMQRLDHSMIFVFIAASYMPMAVLVLHGGLATAVLAVVWVGAVTGIVLSIAWPAAPKGLTALVYIALGWVAVVAMPQLWDQLGAWPVIALGLGGVLYTAGAVIYARERPNPYPEVFGFHEVFHALVIAAAVT